MRTIKARMKKLTVMVSVYNAGEFIENRLDNLSKSTLAQDMEIWVVNANSPDPRDHTVPSELQSDNLKYVKLPERIGVYAAWNYIINNSKSAYITNANADDLIAPNGYEKIIKLLDHTPEFGFVYPSWYTVDTPNLVWEDIRNGKVPSDKSGQPGHYEGDLGAGGVGHFPIWRRSLHNRFGGFDESFKALGDADWWARCYHFGKINFSWIKEYLACYLWRDGLNLWHQEVNENEWHLYHQKVESYRQQSGR